MNIKKLMVPILLSFSVMINAEELNLSNFVKNTSFSGDARINYSATGYSINGTDTDRLSTRFRLNLSTKINDNLSVNGQLRFTDGYSLGTTGNIGSETPSASTAGSDFYTRNLYFNYKKGNHQLQIGRVAAPFYSLNGFLMTDGDKDAIAYSTKIDNTQLKAGYVFLNNGTDSSLNSTEISDKKRALYFQAIQNIAINKDSLAVEATGIAVTQDKKSSDDNVNAVILGASYTHQMTEIIEMVQGKAEYAQILNDKDDNSGLSVGIAFGDNSLKKLGDWKAEAEYKMAGANNVIANSKNQKNMKLWFQTYAGKNSNLEVEYNKRDTYKGTKTVDYSSLEISLNHTF